MKRNRAIVLAALFAVAAAIGLPNSASGVPSSLPAAAYQHNVCGPPAAGTAACHARVVDADNGGPGRAPTPAVSTSPAGLTRTDILTAYGFASSGGAGTTIGIVDAYDNPTALQDIAKFDAAMGLGSCGCTFTKVDQRGGTAYPKLDQGWALEIALDVQWAHAVAPNANILLVEADSNSYADLFAAVDKAAALGAQYISMSWGSSEFSGETSYDSHFLGAGVSYFVSAGDAGTPAEYPSSSPKVISVGGTRLTFTDATKTELSSETGWSSGGGGCSLYESKNAAQPATNLCSTGKRATPDISLDADPASGVSVYMGTPYNGSTGWFTVGGTSASSPMIAGRSALAGVPVNAAYVYGLASSLRDITVGNNGAPCLVGFDLCSGRGSWADNASTVPSTTTTTTAPTTTTTAATTTTAVHVASITHTIAGNKKSFTETVTIRRDSDNTAVAGASVTIQITKDGSPYASGTATTGSNGSVTFRVNAASSGTYATTVTGVSGSSLSWDHLSPTDTLKK